MTETTILLLPGHLDIESVLRILFAVFLFSYVAYILTSTATFFPKFIASVAKKYKNKQNIDVDYNKDYNTVFANLNQSTPKQKESKKNHGRRIPFFNKR